MSEAITERLPQIWRELKQEKRALIILASSSVLLTIAWYPGYYTFFLDTFADRFGSNPNFLWYAHLYQFICDVILMVIAPLIIIKFVLREKLTDFGLRLGDWRFALKYLAVVGIILAPGFYITGADPEFYAEYPLVRGLYAAGGLKTIIAWEATYLIYYIAWEIHFRGFVQLGLEKRVGPALSIMIMMLSTTFIHMRKPFGETFSAIGGAFLIGILAWRSRSIIWCILLHWYIGASTDFWCWRHGLAAGFPDFGG